MQNDEAAWAKMYEDLKAFKKMFGHCNVLKVVREIRHGKSSSQLIQSAGRSNRHK